MVNGQWWPCVTSRQGSMSSLRSVCQAVGLHPLVGFGFFAVDVMLFGEEAATAGIGWAASIPVAFVLGTRRYLSKDIHSTMNGARLSGKPCWSRCSRPFQRRYRAVFFR